MLRTYFVRFFIACLLVNAHCAIGQNMKLIDSLKVQLAKKKIDTVQINLLNRLAIQYSFTDSTNTFLYANQALQKASAIKYQYGIATALTAKANYFVYRTKPMQALPLLNEAYGIWQNLKDEKEQARCLSNIGQAYTLQLKFSEAIVALEKAEKMLLKLKDDVGLNTVYHRLGFVYADKGEKEKAIEYYIKSLEIQNKTGVDNQNESTLNNLGRLLFEIKNYPAAIKYYTQSLAGSTKANDYRNVGITQLNIANVYITQNDYAKGIQLLEQALQSFTKSNFKRGIQACYNNLGALNIRVAKYDSAVVYLKLAMAIAQENQTQAGVPLIQQNIGYALTLQKKYKEALEWFEKAEAVAAKFGADSYTYGEIYNHRATLDSATGNFESALKYRTKFQAINEKLSSERVTKQVTELQTKYETERKDYQINILSKTDSIKSLQISNQQLAINGSLYQIAQQRLALLNDSFLLASQNEKILQNQLDSTQKEDRINNLNKQSQIQDLALNNQKLIINRRNILILVMMLLTIMGALLGFSFYRRYKLQQQAKLQQEILKQQDMATKVVLAAEETERKRIATDLHDGVGQLMSAAKMNLSAIEHELTFVSPVQKVAFEKAMALVDEGCKEVRAVSHNMMPNALLKAGLATVVREFLDNLNSDVIKINLYTDGLKERIDSNTEAVLYRVVQECVNNVIKHAQATLLDISIVKDGRDISITIEDNGIGFDKNLLRNNVGIGLKNIETRMAFLKGSVEWETELGKGTLVVLHAEC